MGGDGGWSKETGNHKPMMTGIGMQSNGKLLLHAANP